MPAASAGEVSSFRVVLQENVSKPFGSLVTERALIACLEHFGAVWCLEMAPTGSTAFVTFQSEEAVATLIRQGTVAVNTISISVKPLVWLPNTPKAEDEQKLASLFSKPTNKPANMRISETRDADTVVAPGKDFEWKLQLSNGSTQPRELLSIEMPHQARAMFALHGPTPSESKPIRLKPGGTHTQTIKFKNRTSGWTGTLKHTLLFNFSNWLLEHTVTLTVADPSTMSDMALLKPAKPYKPTPLPAAEAEPPRHVVPAFPPGRQCALAGALLYTTGSSYGGKAELPQFELPQDITAVVSGAKRVNFNPWKTKNNYRRRMHDLLYLEEAQQAKLTRAYDLRDVQASAVTSFVEGDGETTVYPKEPLTRVACAKLAEKRPSVAVADRVYAWRADGADAGVQYEGFVHRVEAGALLIVFSSDFHTKSPHGCRMHLRFDVERLTPRLMHRAVDACLLETVWPAEQPPPSAEAMRANDAHAESLQLPPEINSQQREVIASLTRSTQGPAPFLLFGPFGTGKTRTLIEFLKLLLAPAAAAAAAGGGGAGGKGAAGGHGKKRGGKGGDDAAAAAAAGNGLPRVLICSPSNSSADQYVHQLSSLLPSSSSLLRLMAPHRPNPRDRTLRGHTHYDTKQGMHTLPSLGQLLGTSAIVTTTRAAAMLASCGVPQGHFTHIVIDEAAQLMEAEALLPLSLAGPKTSVVMAGDPKQLGPSTFSKVDSVYGVHCSIMERLSTLPAYSKRSPAVCMHLTKNYRSHPALVKLLSTISYGGTLRPAAPSERVQALARWEKRGTKRSFPMLFCGLEGGVEEQEGDSPSVFNRQEASTLLVLIQDLLDSFPSELRQEEVGVITPFFRQSQKMRQLLKARNLGGVRVGSTEEFHGHEVKALFISAVRTSTASLEADALYDTGFVGNAKRFNTALSRAVALVVVVGDTGVLCHAPEWRDTISECRQQGCFLTLQAPALPRPPPGGEAISQAPPPPTAPTGAKGTKAASSAPVTARAQAAAAAAPPAAASAAAEVASLQPAIDSMRGLAAEALGGEAAHEQPASAGVAAADGGDGAAKKVKRGKKKREASEKRAAERGAAAADEADGAVAASAEEVVVSGGGGANGGGDGGAAASGATNGANGAHGADRPAGRQKKQGKGGKPPPAAAIQPMTMDDLVEPMSDVALAAHDEEEEEQPLWAEEPVPPPHGTLQLPGPIDNIEEARTFNRRPQKRAESAQSASGATAPSAHDVRKTAQLFEAPPMPPNAVLQADLEQSNGVGRAAGGGGHDAAGRSGGASRSNATGRGGRGAGGTYQRNAPAAEPMAGTVEPMWSMANASMQPATQGVPIEESAYRHYPAGYSQSAYQPATHAVGGAQQPAGAPPASSYLQAPGCISPGGSFTQGSYSHVGSQHPVPASSASIYQSGFGSAPMIYHDGSHAQPSAASGYAPAARPAPTSVQPASLAPLAASAAAKPRADVPPHQRQTRYSHALPSATLQVLYEYEGAPLLSCVGPVPAFAVYERADSVKLVLSTFNLTTELVERPDGFHINLQADPLKRQAASVFRSNSEGEEPAVVDVALGPAFDHGKIEVHEHKTRIKVLLPKKAASRLQLHRVHGD